MKDIQDAIALLKSGKVSFPTRKPLSEDQLRRVKRNSVMKRFREKRLPAENRNSI